MRQVQEESVARAGALEQERESCRSDLTATKERLAEALARLEAAEGDLGRLRYLLNESQSGSERIKKEKELEEREAASSREQVQDEFRRASSALETVTRSEVAMKQQLEDLAARSQQERQRIERELADLKRSSEAQLSEREQRIEWLKAEYEKRIQALESHHTSEVEREKATVDAALHQNEQLRRFFTEQKKTSNAGMSSLQQQLESHINRLQHHTAELRGDLNRSSPQQPILNVASPRGGSSGAERVANSAAPYASSPRAGGSSGATRFPNLGAPSLGAPLLGGSGGFEHLAGSSRLSKDTFQLGAGPAAIVASGMASGPDLVSEPLANAMGGSAWRDLSPGFLRSSGVSR